VSASYIRSLAATAKAFPEAVRNPSLTMGHHRIAAQTESPKVWLKRAADRHWSVREMEDAVRGRSLDDEYQAQVERLEKAVCNSTIPGEPREMSRPCLSGKDRRPSPHETMDPWDYLDDIRKENRVFRRKNG
jgi:hypothetical protein